MDVILIGGFCEIVELCEDNNYHIVGIIDNSDKEEFMSYPVLGSDEDAIGLFPRFKKYHVIISPDSPQVRKRLFKIYNSIGYKFGSLISEKATISRSTNIGAGSIIQANVNISSNVSVGNFVKINSMANIMHDSLVGNYSTIAPNAVVLGKVNINNGCYIGANSTILPQLNIGKNAIVGAGAVVTNNIANNATVKGIPAK